MFSYLFVSQGLVIPDYFFCKKIYEKFGCVEKTTYLCINKKTIDYENNKSNHGIHFR